MTDTDMLSDSLKKLSRSINREARNHIITRFNILGPDQREDLYKSIKNMTSRIEYLIAIIDEEYRKTWESESI